ncbi:MAG: hypothetical protein K6G22_07595 [Lachnospiraceae bacterium]|nr:hypothetical protein [Lachnospiraceae bacterium]
MKKISRKHSDSHQKKKLNTALLISGVILLLVIFAGCENKFGRAGNLRSQKKTSETESVSNAKNTDMVITIKDQPEPEVIQDIAEPEDSEDDPGTEEDSEDVLIYGDPLYCTIWPIQDLTVYSEPERKEKTGTVKGGQTLCVLSEEDGSFKVCYDEEFNTGYVDERFCMINLSEYLKDLCSYNITNSYDSVFRIHEYDIPEITGSVVPGFEDIAMDPASGSFVVPYLYPCAVRLMGAAEKTREDGYILNIYDSFRPHKATRYLYDKVETLLNEPLPDAEEEERTMSEEEVNAINQQRIEASLAEAQLFLMSQGIDPASEQALPIIQFYLDNTEKVTAQTYTHQRTYQEEMTNGSFKLSAFLAKQVSAHNRGIALDLTLRSLDTGKDLEMQSEMHDLSFHSISASNNENAKLLESYMKAEGFNGLSSEWWHFQDDITRNEIKLSTYLEEGVSLEGFKADDRGYKYQNADGSFAAGEDRVIDGKNYSFDDDGYCKLF